MIINDDRKRHLVKHILGPEEGEKEEGGGDALRSCVSELIDAVHNKDTEGAVAAFKACFAACGAEPQLEE